MGWPERPRGTMTQKSRWRTILLSVTVLTSLLLLRTAGAETQSEAQIQPQSITPSDAATLGAYDYRLLATNKTSTMEKELNEAGDAGYRFSAAMGGQTGFGGSEVVIIMRKDLDAATGSAFEYKLLATSKTSTMQKELQEAADAGFEYRGQTVFSSTFGGQEVVVIVERERDATIKAYEYRLLATNKTSTMQKELLEVGNEGFELVGVTVSGTAFGGSEVVSILRRTRLQ
ncbi:MAG: hypothetical protein ACRD1X_07515 [Vicinamibacteria bacterium]